MKIVIRRYTLMFTTTVLIGFGSTFLLHLHQWPARAAVPQHAIAAPARTDRLPRLTRYQRELERRHPGPAITPYIRPEFADQMRALQTVILESAQRHNRPELSHMTNREFAIVLAMLLYNEHFGSLEDRVAPLRALTPFYQDLQTRTNEVGGADLSVWPANLRPSVALEIIEQQVPTPAGWLTVPIAVAGSRIRVSAYHSRTELYAALTRELSNPQLAVEYLATNLERGLYRAQVEGVDVTWRTLAAWHNQGIVRPADVRRNPTASEYIRRTSAYLRAARQLIDQPVRCRMWRCPPGELCC